MKKYEVIIEVVSAEALATGFLMSLEPIVRARLDSILGEPEVRELS